MKVIANAPLVMGAGADRTLLASGAFNVVKGDGDARAIYVYQGGGFDPDRAQELPDGPPVVVVELSAVELRLLVVMAMKTEGVDFGADAGGPALL